MPAGGAATAAPADRDVRFLPERVAQPGAAPSEAAGEARSPATDLRGLPKRTRAVTGALAGPKRLARRLIVLS